MDSIVSLEKKRIKTKLYVTVFIAYLHEGPFYINGFGGTPSLATANLNKQFLEYWDLPEDDPNTILKSYNLSDDYEKIFGHGYLLEDSNGVDQGNYEVISPILIGDGYIMSELGEVSTNFTSEHISNVVYTGNLFILFLIGESSYSGLYIQIFGNSIDDVNRHLESVLKKLFVRVVSDSGVTYDDFESDDPKLMVDEWIEKYGTLSLIEGISDSYPYEVIMVNDFDASIRKIKIQIE